MNENTRQPLKLGLLLPTQEGTMAGGTPRWHDILTLSQRAESIGLDSVWVADHFLFTVAETLTNLPGMEGFEIPNEQPRGSWDGWSLMAGLAAAVPRISIGALVMCTNYRNPALLAKAADTIDEISGGRFILGLGAGDSAFEHNVLGIPFDHRVSRFEEALQIIHALLKTGQCDFQGDYYQISNSHLRPRGPRPEGPPLLIGAFGNGKRMRRLSAQYADMWNIWLPPTRSQPATLATMRTMTDEACETYGRDPASLIRTATVVVNPLGLPIPGLIKGSPEEIATTLLSFAAEGISDIQFHMMLNSREEVEALAPIVKCVAEMQRS